MSRGVGWLIRLIPFCAEARADVPQYQLFDDCIRLLECVLVTGEQPDATKSVSPRMATDHLANWIDGRFAVAWQESKIVPTEVVDDAAFLKRTHLDLTGAIPSVSEARDYLEQTSLHRRGMLVDRLLNLNDDHSPREWSRRLHRHISRQHRDEDSSR